MLDYEVWKTQGPGPGRAKDQASIMQSEIRCACLSLSRMDRVVSRGTGSRVNEQVKVDIFAV